MSDERESPSILGPQGEIESNEIPVEEDGINVPKNNVLGVSPDTHNPIVTPTYKETEKFSQQHFNEHEGKKASNAEELLANIGQTSDYQVVELPSNGLLYPKDSPFADGKILVRPMRSGEEEILTTPQLFKNGQAIEMIFRRCIMFQDRTSLKNPQELLSIDRMYLLIWIRGVSYDQNYECSVTCGSCRRQFDAIIDLDKLNKTSLEDPTYKEPLKSVLPSTGYSFEYRLQRGYDEIELLQMQKQREKRISNATDQTLLNRASLLVLSIGGISDKDVIRKALQQMKLEDLRFMRECFDNPPFGVDTQVQLDCPHCGAENEMALPLGADFFFPRARKHQDLSITQE